MSHMFLLEYMYRANHLFFKQIKNLYTVSYHHCIQYFKNFHKNHKGYKQKYL